MKPNDAPKCEWNLTTAGDPTFVIGSAVTTTLKQGAQESMPELGDLFPFQKEFTVESHFDQEWFSFRIIYRGDLQFPSVKNLETTDLDQLRRKVLPFRVRAHHEVAELLGNRWVDFDRFTYVGPFSEPYASWSHVVEHLNEWLRTTVMPRVDELNRLRILRAIPPAPSFDIEKISSSIWVLECEIEFRQGTAFGLRGYGLVTCEHVLGPNTQAFRANLPSRRFPVTVIKSNRTLDLAILRISEMDFPVLEPADAIHARQMDHLAVAGFPNYRLGDSGIINPGIVVGFRMVSGIRRILTNAAIVAGNSGGPAIGPDGRVIGVAVTGTDRMENARDTENHAVIPIDALSILLSQ